nr:TBC1 domain family member 1 [Leptinotarsa decemlineata]
MTRFSQADLDQATFLYLLRDDREQLLYCYLFQAMKISDVTDLYKQMKEQNHAAPTKSISSAGNLTSLCVDISPSSSNFFEVLYIGKIKVWQRKVPDNFIDEALEKFRIHELEKHGFRQLGNIGKLKSESELFRRGSVDSSNGESSCEKNLSSPATPPLLRSQSVHSNLIKQPSDTKNESDIPELKNDGGIPITPITKSCNDDSANNNNNPSQEVNTHREMDDHNRTMVLQVDRTDLRLISPDRKIILLHKHHRDITTCLQGQLKPEHFGFICKEGSNNNYFMGYIFKCESSSVANDTMAAITQAFLNAETKTTCSTVTSCEHCPMVWFHKLCVEVETMSDRKTQAAILRRIEQLDDDEQTTILTKFRGAETDSVREQNEFLMMLLRAHCEMKQGRHVHDTAENRSEFLNQYLGGGTIFTKAKRSLSNSFEHFLKRKGSRDDFGGSLKGLNLPINSNFNKDCLSHSPSPSTNNDTSDRESEGTRSRSSTIGSQNDLRDTHLSVRDNNHKDSYSPERVFGSEKAPKSPMMDIFMKVGNSPKNTISEDGCPNKVDSGSWRQAIFKRVVTPNKLDRIEQPGKQRTKEELRVLWKKSIHQAILLIRMEKENARIRAKQEESAVKRIKLEYDEMKPNQREVIEVWEMITTKDSNRIKCDNQMLLHAIRQGVPRSKRGDVWQFLADQFCSRVPPIDTINYPNYAVPYETLLKQLTSHQHAILIDLGRTFPNHSYFSSPLGPGQLALFNVLKAYSLLDPEVGYCQGLSFVAGVLLLHMEESQAFLLLKYLMFRRGMRNQYLPDMVSLQIKLYQLSRLVRDHLPELYTLFDTYEVAPTLYAAPWLLTVFASQFPLGFVTRVFDLMFLEGPEVIFRVSLALLSHHKEKLLVCDSFEEIMNYLKVQLPKIDRSTLDILMKQVFTTDCVKQLNEYKVEYQVLQEEMTSVQPQVEALHKLESQNKLLSDQNQLLMRQLESTVANVHRLEKTRALQQSQLNRLEMQSRGLNVTIATLGAFINSLMEQKVDVEIPDDIQRILTQLSFSERRQNEGRPQQNNLMRTFQKPSDKIFVKSQSTGKMNVPSNVNQSEFGDNVLNGMKTSPPSSTEKTSKFFSNSHNNILQQKLNVQNSNLNNARIDITIQQFENELNSNTTVNQRSFNEEMEFENSEVSLTKSDDSGVVTPVSPIPLDNHPLSNCGVPFTYTGTRELKTMKNMKNSRNYNPDVVSK